MWRLPFYILTDRQLQKFFNRAYQLGQEEGWRLRGILAQNRGIITGKPTKMEQELREILKKKGE